MGSQTAAAQEILMGAERLARSTGDEYASFSCRSAHRLASQLLPFGSDGLLCGGATATNELIVSPVGQSRRRSNLSGWSRIIYKARQNPVEQGSAIIVQRSPKVSQHGQEDKEISPQGTAA
ncbi:MAG: hypothetical protein ACR2PI_10675 [Hyphomicrobiaceae bacterium]